MEALLWFGAFIGALVFLLSLRIPVAVSMGLIGILGTAVFVSPRAVVQIANIAYSQTWSFVLVIVPLFVLMGEVIAISGLGAALFRAAAIWLRRLPGGLAIGTIAASAGFASVCGSSPITAATIGSMAVPEMIKHGYARSLAAGATAAGGTLGILIPPSVPMILFGVITETSIGGLFLAGILPGLMMATLLSATVILQVVMNRSMAPPIVRRVSFSERMRTSAEALPTVLIALMVIGALYAGIASPSETGAFGAAAAVLVALAMGRLRGGVLSQALQKTVRTTGMFMLLLIGGLFSSFVLTRLGVPQDISTYLTGLDVAPWMIIVMINILLLIMGMFLDPLSILVIVVPIFLDTIVGLGYDPIWFGVIVTIQIEIAAITPPVGLNLFVLRTVVPDLSISDTARGAVAFVIPMLVGIVLLLLFPQIALWLPGLRF
ncbi:TRAP transporter large permease [Celeribacter indicus]|uniref:TRAP transporter large permease protein n=1 Tax=Celeribacter indicus TaxID=1208324 RepID=A0A0B5E815_9RHOB|nr:TRAP transporter large permease [Celeribacter indicus]AJE48452.1 TRAP dicarboxylate transporter DctM subunit [Celeribacter indicus]SDX28985.1 C4-dicarboxylate transporter, DctM subunit [Celeribacter indicus]